MKKRYQVSRTIRAPARRVWDLLADAESYGDWNPTILSIRGPIEPGRTVELVSELDPKRTFKLRVAIMQAPHRMVWSGGMPLGLFRGERTFELHETGAATRFSMTEELSGPLAGLISKTIPDMTDSFNRFAEGLKRAAESGREAQHG